MVETELLSAVDGCWKNIKRLRDYGQVARVEVTLGGSNRRYMNRPFAHSADRIGGGGGALFDGSNRSQRRRRRRRQALAAAAVVARLHPLIIAGFLRGVPSPLARPLYTPPRTNIRARAAARLPPPCTLTGHRFAPAENIRPALNILHVLHHEFGGHDAGWGHRPPGQEQTRLIPCRRGERAPDDEKMRTREAIENSQATSQWKNKGALPPSQAARQRSGLGPDR